jgi:hypothetical protein
VARPMTRLDPAQLPVLSGPPRERPPRADTRIFRIWWSGKDFPEFGSRRVLGTKLGNTGWSRKGKIDLIEATDADATTGWKDVSSEFGIGA